MRYDQSYGIVPLQKEGARWRVFLVRHQSGHWTLPKGHPEGNESPLECARRELFEETALSIVKQLFDEPLHESYQFTSRGRPVHKTVTYFVAVVAGKVTIQREELQEGRWVELDQADRLATYPQMKSLLRSVVDMVNKLP